MDITSQSSDEQTLVIKECGSCHRYVGEFGTLYYPDNDWGDHYIEEKGKKHICLNVCDGVMIVSNINYNRRLTAFIGGAVSGAVSFVGLVSLMYLVRRYKK
jgi:hypothetical protein